jgi:hypothetical protein
VCANVHNIGAEIAIWRFHHVNWNRYSFTADTGTHCSLRGTTICLEECGLLSCNAVKLGKETPKLWRRILLPNSGSKYIPNEY